MRPAPASAIATPPGPRRRAPLLPACRRVASTTSVRLALRCAAAVSAWQKCGVAHVLQLAGTIRETCGLAELLRPRYFPLDALRYRYVGPASRQRLSRARFLESADCSPSCDLLRSVHSTPCSATAERSRHEIYIRGGTRRAGHCRAA